MSCQANAKNPRPAVSRFEVLQRWESRSLVRVYPETGRNHQIRVHFAAIGHPLLNEPFYAAHGGFLPRCEQSGSLRHALHAESIQFDHPITAVRMNFRTLLPVDLQQCLQAD